MSKKAKKMLLFFFFIIFIFIIANNRVRITKLEAINEKIKIMNKEAQDYYYLCSPNGNTLEVIEKSSDTYEYLLHQFNAYNIKDRVGFKYELSFDERGNMNFYHTGPGLITGSRHGNRNADFPKCLIKKNDSSGEQKFFLGEVNEFYPITYVGYMYISLSHPLSYDEMMKMCSNIEQNLTVTWLWVNTYSPDDIEDINNGSKIIVQRPAEGQLGVCGIPLNINGNDVEEPLDKFLTVINSEHTYIKDLTIYKNNISDNNEVTESDLEILGFVAIANSMPASIDDLREIESYVLSLENIKCVTS